VEDEIRKLAQSYLGDSISDEEWEEAYPAAQRKLEWIESLEGIDEERRKPYYIAQLASEHLKQKALSIFTFECCRILLDDDPAVLTPTT
jgi:hypothetical protein